MINKADPVGSPCLPTSKDEGWRLLHCKKVTNNAYECTLAVGKGRMKKVEARGAELFGGEKLEGKKPGRTRQCVSATVHSLVVNCSGPL